MRTDIHTSSILTVYVSIHLTVEVSSRTVPRRPAFRQRQWCIRVTRESKNKHAGCDELVIALKDLQNGPLIIERAIGLPKLGERLQHCEYDATPLSANVNLRLELCGGGVALKGHAEARIQAQCSTCLADTIVDIFSPISAFLMQRPGELEQIDDIELTPEDLEKEWYEGDTVSLDPIVFDAVLLEMPMNPKCSSTCPGIATGISNDKQKEIDPRLAPLANLKIKKER